LDKSKYLSAFCKGIISSSCRVECVYNGHPGDLSPGGGVLLGGFGGGVPPASPNLDPISDQKMPFSTPVFRPGLKNPYPFSDLTLYVIKHNICISAARNST